MQNATIKDLIRTNRSYRSFDRSSPVPKDLLLEMVDAARLSPSSINLQMLKFRLVFSEEECSRLFPLTRWAGKIKDRKLPPVGHEPTAYIVICADTEVIPTAESFQKDVGIAAQSMMLTATAAGFGGCMIGSFSKTDVAEALHLSDNLHPQLILALGKPDETVRLIQQTGDLSYYREGEIHYVPKRSLEELIL